MLLQVILYLNFIIDITQEFFRDKIHPQLKFCSIYKLANELKKLIEICC